MKNIITVVLSLIAAVLIVVFIPSSRILVSEPLASGNDVGIFHQSAVRISGSPVTVYPVYEDGEMIGILSDENKLKRYLKSVYKTQFAQDYPGSSVSLGRNMYMVETESWFTYTNADDEILAYIGNNQLFTLEATAVSFSDEDGVYSRIYVTNEDLYQEALNEYILYFISSQSLASLRSGDLISQLTSFGSQETGISISQKIATTREYASVDEILSTKEDILEYLKYGSNKEREYYTVQKYDTVAGVGSKNHGLSATQIMNINRDKISSVDQVLVEGEELCVTYFESPIDVVVTRDTLRQVPIYYETSYVEDENILIGESEVRQDGTNGARNVLYNEKWINGVLVSGTEVSSAEVFAPKSEVIAVGTMQKPDTGTGDLRYPVDNPAITCRVGCYWGHNGNDFINQYDRWGNVYAADTGVVEANAYTWVNGYYVIINHNNGYMTYYGHMQAPSPLKTGDIVTKGDVIGSIGMTGLASGPHVHFMVLKDGDINFQDPLDACSGFLNCEVVPAG